MSYQSKVSFSKSMEELHQRLAQTEQSLTGLEKISIKCVLTILALVVKHNFGVNFCFALLFVTPCECK